jgi:hypothetical protein
MSEICDVDAFVPALRRQQHGPVTGEVGHADFAAPIVGQRALNGPNLHQPRRFGCSEDWSRPRC